MAKYKSPFTVDYRKPIIVASDDPRNKNGKNLNKYKSRAGSKVITTTIAEPLKLTEGNTYPYWIQSKEYQDLYSSVSLNSNNTGIWLSERQGWNISSNPNHKISRYTYNGILIWQTVINSPSNVELNIYGGLPDSNSNFYIFGYIGTSGQDSQRGYIGKLDTNGNVLWEKKVDILEGYWYDKPCTISSIEFDLSNNIYLSLYVSYNPKLQIIKMDPDGNIIWTTTKQSGLTNTYVGAAGGFKVDSSNNLYFTCSYQISNSYYTALGKLDSNGTLQWLTYLNSNLYGAKIDNEGNIYVNASVPYVYNEPGFHKFDSNGSLLLSFYFGEVLSQGYLLTDFAFDSSNNILCILNASYQISQMGDQGVVMSLDSNFQEKWRNKYVSGSYAVGLKLHEDSFLLTTQHSFAKFPQDGTKTGYYYFGSQESHYDSTPITSTGFKDFSTTQITSLNSTSTIIGLSIVDYPTNHTTSNYIPSIVRF